MFGLHLCDCRFISTHTVGVCVYSCFYCTVWVRLSVWFAWSWQSNSHFLALTPATVTLIHLMPFTAQTALQAFHISYVLAKWHQWIWRCQKCAGYQGSSFWEDSTNVLSSFVCPELQNHSSHATSYLHIQETWNGHLELCASRRYAHVGRVSPRR